MSTVPPMLRALVDDAAVFPPGNAALPDTDTRAMRRTERTQAPTRACHLFSASG